MPAQLDTAKIAGGRHFHSQVANEASFPLTASLLNAGEEDGVKCMKGEFLEWLISLVLRSKLQLERSGAGCTSLCLHPSSLFPSLDTAAKLPASVPVAMDVSAGGN